MKKTKKLRSFWYSLSSRQRFLIRRLYYLPIDVFDKITGKTHPYVPARGLIYTGSPASAKNYIQQGSKQLDLLKETINLQPNDAILDIGSGIGRTAIALTGYHNKNGTYDGFDVDSIDETINKLNNRSMLLYQYISEQNETEEDAM